MVYVRLVLAAVLLAWAIPAQAQDMVVRATWYGSAYHGRLMRNGQPFNMYDPSTVAARDLKIGTRIQLTNLRNGRSITAVVRDKSPYARIDCSFAGAEVLGFVDAGSAHLRVDIIVN